MSMILDGRHKFKLAHRRFDGIIKSRSQPVAIFLTTVKTRISEGLLPTAFMPSGERINWTTEVEGREEEFHHSAVWIPFSSVGYNIRRQFAFVDCDVLCSLWMIVFGFFMDGFLLEDGVGFVISPKSVSSVVLDAPEPSKLLSAIAIALSNCSRACVSVITEGFCPSVITEGFCLSVITEGFFPSVITECFCPSVITEGFWLSVITEGQKPSVNVSDKGFTDGLLTVGNRSLPTTFVKDAKLGGPVQYRWMYPIERYLGKLKSYVHNKAQAEGSITKG
ncbi:hypothetical protein V8G54_019738 [Vigna mungo]|uniref:DUF4218 domain-containing protein n=1 Tax=Vigna mungo TaxID=3915 RepID=A0AAQ3RU17_VIGMU